MARRVYFAGNGTHRLPSGQNLVRGVNEVASAADVEAVDALDVPHVRFLEDLPQERQDLIKSEEDAKAKPGEPDPEREKAAAEEAGEGPGDDEDGNPVSVSEAIAEATKDSEPKPGEPNAEREAEAAKEAGDGPQDGSVDDALAEAAKAEGDNAPQVEPTFASDEAEQAAKDAGLNPADIEGSGKDGHITAGDVRKTVKQKEE